MNSFKPRRANLIEEAKAAGLVKAKSALEREAKKKAKEDAAYMELLELYRQALQKKDYTSLDELKADIAKLKKERKTGI